MGWERYNERSNERPRREGGEMLVLGLEEGESVWWWLQVESTEIFSVPKA